jgi:hypothetical protein
MLRAAVLVFATSLSLGTAAQGKPNKVFAELIGCWQIKNVASRSQQDLCLAKGGNANAGWLNSEEGMYSPGTYRSKGNELTIYGTDGHGGPPKPELVTHCRFALVFKGSELVVRDCAFEGDWKRLCRNWKNEQGAPACVQDPAN